MIGWPRFNYVLGLMLGFSTTVISPQDVFAAEDAVFTAITNYFETETQPKRRLLVGRDTVDAEYKDSPLEATVLDYIHTDISGDDIADTVFVWSRKASPDEIRVSALMSGYDEPFHIDYVKIAGANDARIAAKNTALLEVSVQRQPAKTEKLTYSVLYMNPYFEIVKLPNTQIDTPSQRKAIDVWSRNALEISRNETLENITLSLCDRYTKAVFDVSLADNAAGTVFVDEVLTYLGKTRSDAQWKDDFTKFWNNHSPNLICSADSDFRFPQEPFLRRILRDRRIWMPLQRTIFSGDRARGVKDFPNIKLNGLTWIDGRFMTSLDMINYFKPLPGERVNTLFKRLERFIPQLEYGQRFEDVPLSYWENLDE